MKDTAVITFCPHSQCFPWVVLRFPGSAAPSCADYTAQAGSLYALVAYLHGKGVTEFRVVAS